MKDGHDNKLQEDSQDLKMIVDKYREYVMSKANLAEVLQVVNMASMKRILKQEKPNAKQH